MTDSKEKAAQATRVQVRDDEGNFLFRKEWLRNYVVIDGPMSKVALTVTSQPNLYDPNDGTSPRYIVNTKAVLREDLAELKDKFGKGDHVRAADVNHLFLSGTIWVNDGQSPDVPMKGEKILCNIDHVYSPALDEDVLRITNIAVAPAEEAEKLDIDAFFADDPNGVFADVTEEAFENAVSK